MKWKKTQQESMKTEIIPANEDTGFDPDDEEIDSLIEQEELELFLGDDLRRNF